MPLIPTPLVTDHLAERLTRMATDAPRMNGSKTDRMLRISDKDLSILHQIVAMHATVPGRLAQVVSELSGLDTAEWHRRPSEDKRPPSTRSRLVWWRLMRARGWSYPAIAKFTGANHATVLLACRKNKPILWRGEMVHPDVAVAECEAEYARRWGAENG